MAHVRHGVMCYTTIQHGVAVLLALIDSQTGGRAIPTVRIRCNRAATLTYVNNLESSLARRDGRPCEHLRACWRNSSVSEVIQAEVGRVNLVRLLALRVGAAPRPQR